MGVLQRIGMCYLLAALIVRYGGVRGALALLAAPAWAQEAAAEAPAASADKIQGLFYMKEKNSLHYGPDGDRYPWYAELYVRNAFDKRAKTWAGIGARIRPSRGHPITTRA